MRPRPALKVAAAVSAGTALWLSLGLLAITDPDSARRVGFLPPWWLLIVALASAIVVVVAMRVSSTACLPLFLSLLIVLPWLPFPVPDVFLALTGPVTLLVWGAIAIAVGAMAAQKIRSRWPSAMRAPRAAPYLAAMLAFVVFLAVWSGQRLPPTGDEPHYLITAQSILRDRDVKVANNYQRGDYLPYYGGVLEPHFSRPGVDGEMYPGHALGLSALAAPVFAAGGYRSVVIFIAALAAMGTALIWKAGHLVTHDAGAAWFGWAIVTLTVPVVVYGSLVYPDPVAGFVFAACAYLLVRADAGTRLSSDTEHATTPWPLAVSIGLGIGIGLLPWLHMRMVLPAAVLSAIFLGRIASFRARRWNHAIAVAGPVAVCLVGWIAYSRIIYGTFNPAAPFTDPGLLQVQRIPVGFLGLLTDQEFGLLPHAPVHMLAIGGLWPLFKRNKRLAIELLLVIAPYAVTLSAWGVWWAGSCPPARFLVPVIFPLGVAAAVLWTQQDGRGRTVSLTMLGASIVVGAVFAFGGDGGLAYNRAVGRARWLDWISPLVDLPRAFPSFFRSGERYSPTMRAVGVDLAMPALFWVMALVAGRAAFVTIDKRAAGTRAVRALVAPACLALACGIATIASWQIAGDGHLIATRAQLDALRRGDRLRPIGVQLFPWHLAPPRDLATHLAISTSSLDRSPPSTLLSLEEVPAGDYRLRATRKASGPGELALGIGRATSPIERWSLSDAQDDEYAFHLPVLAASVIVTGDRDALRAIDKVALIPASQLEPHSEAGRARDAARYGGVVVYAIDDRIWLEAGGFWVMGDRRPDVVMATDRPVRFLEVMVKNRPVANTVRVRSGRWYDERVVQPDELWSVRVPLPAPGRDLTVGFDVARGIRPIDVDPTRHDRRSLGCWIEVR